MNRQRNSIWILLLVVLTLSCDTGSNVDPVFERFYTKYYGEDGNQESVDLLINGDGTMILLGNSSPTRTSEGYYPFIVKVDPLGNVFWQRRMGEMNERAVDVELDSQGNLMVVSNIGDEPNSRIRLYRIDQNGQGLDSLKIEMGEKQVAGAVTAASDGSFLIAAYAAPNIDRNPKLETPPPDEADIIVVRVDPTLASAAIISDIGGGEHVGRASKVFESDISGFRSFLIFGDSDLPLEDNDAPVYKQSFKVIGIDEFGTPNGLLKASGDDLAGEVQISSRAIETSGGLQDGYLLVGTTYPTTKARSVYITQYDKTFAIRRINRKVTLLNDDATPLEGVSAAIGPADDFYILANAITPNNRRDVILLKLSTDGTVINQFRFGTLEGDDLGGAVGVLPDRRIVLVSTIELETQSKLALMVLSPDGKFSF